MVTSGFDFTEIFGLVVGGKNDGLRIGRPGKGAGGFTDLTTLFALSTELVRVVLTVTVVGFTTVVTGFFEPFFPFVTFAVLEPIA